MLFWSMLEDKLLDFSFKAVVLNIKLIKLFGGRLL